MKPNIHKPIQASIYGLLPIFSFLYFYICVDTSVIYFSQQPLFLSDWFFFKQFVIYPGGITNYISLFFSQFLFPNLLGSIVYSFIITVAFVITRAFYKQIFSTQSSWVVALIPSLMLITLLSNYRFDLQAAIIFLAVSSFSMLYIALRQSSIYIKLVFISISIISIFYLFGSTALAGYVLITVLYDFFRNKNKHIAITTAIQVALPIVLIYLLSTTSTYYNFDIATKGIFAEHNTKPVLLPLIILMAFFPLAIIVSPATIHIEKFFSKSIVTLSILGVIRTSIIIAVFALIFITSPIKSERRAIELHKYASENNWDKVLDISKGLPQTERKVFFQNNRAHFHRGELLENGFSFPQWFGEHGLILTPYYNSQVLMLCSDLYHEMGFIKGSLHWAYEAQTKYELAPNVIKRIIEDNILLGNKMVAEKFLNILSKSIVHQNWVNEHRSYIHDSKKLKKSLLLGKLSDMPLLRESFSNSQHPQYDLAYILDENPNNKMAFEYLMFHAMLRHDLSEIINNLKYLTLQGYTKIPRHIEEALVMAIILRENLKIDTGSLQISKVTQNKFVEYSTMLMKHKRDKTLSQAAIQEKFGDTFWYYIHFISPITNKREFKEKKEHEE